MLIASICPQDPGIRELLRSVPAVIIALFPDAAPRASMLRTPDIVLPEEIETPKDLLRKKAYVPVPYKRPALKPVSKKAVLSTRHHRPAFDTGQCVRAGKHFLKR